MRRAWLPTLCALLQVLAVGTGDSRPSVVLGGGFVVLGLAAGASVGWRDRFPSPVLGFCALAYAGQALLLAPPVPAALAVTSFSLVRRPHPSEGPRHTRSVAGALAAAVAVGAAGVALSGERSLDAPFALVVVTAIALGQLLASHDAREESRRRELLADQRLRIARDLHDVVGHSVGGISVQAGAARMALAAGVPADATTAVGNIETASRDLLREVRWLVGLLREDVELPGMPEVDGLLENARRSGLDLRVARTGSAGDVPPEVGHAAYRILQEAVTNVLRHGAGQRADVQVQVADALCIRVCNPSPDAAEPEGGHGLLGMAERAQEVGGTVRAGRDGPATWLVEARLPLRVPR